MVLPDGIVGARLTHSSSVAQAGVHVGALALPSRSHTSMRRSASASRRLPMQVMCVPGRDRFTVRGLTRSTSPQKARGSAQYFSWVRLLPVVTSVSTSDFVRVGA